MNKNELQYIASNFTTKDLINRIKYVMCYNFYMNERQKNKNIIGWYNTDDNNYMIINWNDKNKGVCGFIKYNIKWNGELNWEIIETARDIKSISDEAEPKKELKSSTSRASKNTIVYIEPNYF